MKKIMFNDKYELTDAVLKGRKTQTRRICKNCVNPRLSPFVSSGVENEHGYEIKSSYKPNEIIAIAQSYKDLNKDFIPISEDVLKGTKKGSQWGNPANMKGWSNKMFVRADVMEHHIRITNVHMERLQSISDEDCIKEGIEIIEPYGSLFYCIPQIADKIYMTPREAYATLIDKISGKGTWDSNPWVWVYDFELVD